MPYKYIAFSLIQIWRKAGYSIHHCAYHCKLTYLYRLIIAMNRSAMFICVWYAEVLMPNLVSIAFIIAEVKVLTQTVRVETDRRTHSEIYRKMDINTLGWLSWYPNYLARGLTRLCNRCRLRHNDLAKHQ